MMSKKWITTPFLITASKQVIDLEPRGESMSTAGPRTGQASDGLAERRCQPLPTMLVMGRRGNDRGVKSTAVLWMAGALHQCVQQAMEMGQLEEKEEQVVSVHTCKGLGDAAGRLHLFVQQVEFQRQPSEQEKKGW